MNDRSLHEWVEESRRRQLTAYGKTELDRWQARDTPRACCAVTGILELRHDANTPGTCVGTTLEGLLLR